MMTSNRNMIPEDVYVAEMQKAASMYTFEELDWVNKAALEDQLINVSAYRAIADGLNAALIYGEPIHFYTPDEIIERNYLLGLIHRYNDEHPEDYLTFIGPAKKDDELGWTQLLTDGYDWFQAILAFGELFFLPYND